MFNLPENNFIGSEDEMVKNFITAFIYRDIRFSNNWLKGVFYEQIRVPEIKRISDLIIYCSDRRLINIEFKLKDHKCVLSQASDHLRWADYSFICIPFTCYSFLPKNYITKLKSKGIGLILSTEYSFIELIRPKHNSYKNGKNREIRNIMLNRIKQSSKC